MGRTDDYIAVFDSGVGGISVLRHLLQELPHERFLYFGDSANAPYGVRPMEEVQALVLQAADRLISRNVKALVVACNTAAATSAELLRSTYPGFPIICIEPAVKPAADRFPGGRIGVMATPATMESPRFKRLLARFDGVCEFVLLPAPGLPELVEADKQNGPEGEALLRPLLDPYAGKLDAVVLGCTHYPFAEEMLLKILGKQTVLLDGGPGVARQTRRRLEELGLLREGEGELVIENSLPGQSMEALCKRLNDALEDKSFVTWSKP